MERCEKKRSGRGRGGCERTEKRGSGGLSSMPGCVYMGCLGCPAVQSHIQKQARMQAHAHTRRVRKDVGGV